MLHAVGEIALSLTALDLGVVGVAAVLLLGSAWLLRRLTPRPELRARNNATSSHSVPGREYQPARPARVGEEQLVPRSSARSGARGLHARARRPRVRPPPRR